MAIIFSIPPTRAALYFCAGTMFRICSTESFKNREHNKGMSQYADSASIA